MPYVSLSTGAPISDEKKEVLQKKIGQLISIIPGKSSPVTMIKIEDDCDMYMGEEKANWAFCEVRLLGEAPYECKNEFYLKFRQLLKEQIDIKEIYLNYVVFNEWGSRDNFRHL
ncbi:MAG: hypothetical protein FWG21_01245 [Oscillospiraceae bacterium]|nr:hypothetical protein [Oscillospiraceae bacterium]